MTNKKKATKKDRGVESSTTNKSSTTNSGDTSSPPKTEIPKNFSKAQFTTLIFLAIGFSKVVELSTAASETFEKPDSCLLYMKDEGACRHESLVSWIQSKYQSATQLSWLVVCLSLQCWNYEVFLKLDACLCTSPLITTMIANWASSDYIDDKRGFHLTIMCMVLMAVATPTSIDSIPFLTMKKIPQFNSLQVMGLMACVITNLAEIVMVYKGGMENGKFITTTPFPESAQAIVNYWIVDKISMAVLLAFTIVHFDEARQRNFLMFVSIMKFFEYLVQIPSYNDELVDLSGSENIVLGIAIFTLVAAYSPKISWS